MKVLVHMTDYGVGDVAWVNVLVQGRGRGDALTGGGGAQGGGRGSGGGGPGGSHGRGGHTVTEIQEVNILVIILNLSSSSS